MVLRTEVPVSAKVGDPAGRDLQFAAPMFVCSSKGMR